MDKYAVSKDDSLYSIDMDTNEELASFKTSNIVHMVGTICSEIVYSHSVNDEKFYKMSIKTIRSSGVADINNVIISRKLTGNMVKNGDRVEIWGNFRSYRDRLNCATCAENECVSKGNDKPDPETQCRLHRKNQLYVFASRVCTTDVSKDDRNDIMLIGDVIKIYSSKKTRSGRNVIDITMKVVRDYKTKYDYLPCIIWGRDACCILDKNVSIDNPCKVKVVGRLQSRNYTKKNIDGTIEHNITYEMSVSNVEYCDVDTDIIDNYM